MLSKSNLESKTQLDGNENFSTQLRRLTQAMAVMVTELEMKLSPLFMLTCRVADLWHDKQRRKNLESVF